jgi:hypothetical protein
MALGSTVSITCLRTAARTNLTFHTTFNTTTFNTGSGGTGATAWTAPAPLISTATSFAAGLFTTNTYTTPASNQPGIVFLNQTAVSPYAYCLKVYGLAVITGTTYYYAGTNYVMSATIATNVSTVSPSSVTFSYEFIPTMDHLSTYSGSGYTKLNIYIPITVTNVAQLTAIYNAVSYSINYTISSVAVPTTKTNAL